MVRGVFVIGALAAGWGRSADRVRGTKEGAEPLNEKGLAAGLRLGLDAILSAAGEMTELG
jgi:hypothetical protein